MKHEIEEVVERYKVKLVDDLVDIEARIQRVREEPHLSDDTKDRLVRAYVSIAMLTLERMQGTDELMVEYFTINDMER